MAKSHRDLAPPPQAIPEPCVELVYELLDAHDDTVRLALELTDDPRWAVQLDYLQSLQRVARTMLAHAGAE